MDPQYYAARTHEKMKEVLMNPESDGPDIHYYMIRGGSKRKNITVWQAGKCDGEYVKTYGHYHVGELSETYWITFGEGIAISQKRAEDENGNPIDDEIVKAAVEAVGGAGAMSGGGLIRSPNPIRSKSSFRGGSSGGGSIKSVGTTAAEEEPIPEPATGFILVSGILFALVLNIFEYILKMD